MKRRTRRDVTIALTLALSVIGLLLAAGGAEAATLTTKCSGKGIQNKAQEYETASCVVEAGQKRNIEGVLRNDKNQPVAGTLNVTFSNWEPQGGGAYGIVPYKTIQVKSGANGKFTIPKVTTSTEESVFIESVEDAESSLSVVTTEINIQRLVTATVKTSGGGHVKVTIKGAKPPFKVGITEEEGYFVSGGTAKKANKAGVATFHLGSTYGKVNVFFEAGELSDLYYFTGKSFKP
jgi:hypothetical protein